MEKGNGVPLLAKEYEYVGTPALKGSTVRRSPSEVYGVCHQNKRRILLGKVRTSTSNTAKSFVYFDDALHILVKATSVRGWDIQDNDIRKAEKRGRGRIDGEKRIWFFFCWVCVSVCVYVSPLCPLLRARLSLHSLGALRPLFASCPSDQFF